MTTSSARAGTARMAARERAANGRRPLNWRFPLLVGAVWVAAAALLVTAAWLWFGHTWSLTTTLLRWDGGWYFGIATRGYAHNPIHHQANVGFFPLYPLLVAGVARALRVPALAAGVAVSVASFVAALVLFYDFVVREYGAAVARWATVLLAFNPFGLFFGVVYTESLFLMLSVAVFWLVQRRWWWMAAVVAGLASATRSVGLALGLYVVAQWAWERRELWAEWRRDWGWWRPVLTMAGLGLISISGLVGFCVFLQLHNHDALAFVRVQKYWERTGPGGLVAESAKNWRQLAGNISGRHWILHRLNVYTIWYASTVLALAGLWLLVRQRAYWLAGYVAVGLAVPLASGTVVSMNRYAMVLFPLYIGLARVLHGRWRWGVLALSGVAWVAYWGLYLSPRLLFFG